MDVDRSPRECPLAGVLAERLRLARDELTSHWLARISERVSIDPNRVFPTSDLLDHVPLLIDGIADYLENPAAEVGTEAPVVGKAMELGALRHAQGFDAYEILKEYEILGGILFNHLANEADAIPEPCAKSELLACGQRLFRAVSIIQNTTTSHFLRLAQEQVHDREERLRAFNRAVSHEIKNRIGAVLGSADVLHEIPGMPQKERERFVQIIRRNARSMQSAVTNVLAISRTAGDPRQQRHIHLPEAAREAMRQVRETAQAAGVDLQLDPGTPDVEVNAAVVELCLVNYLSNAIKYARHGDRAARAEITGRVETSPSGESELVVRVRDNGIGVPAAKRDQLFHRFFRAHETVTEAEGTGLGLSIVRDAVESLGGRAWAEFPERGSTFAFALPARRGRSEGAAGAQTGTSAASSTSTVGPAAGDGDR